MPRSLLAEDFFTQHPLDCARQLIGCAFRHRRVGGLIVETEAYTAEGDEACHTFFRPSARAFIDQHPAGTGYVYLNYGMYWLVNVLVKHRTMHGFVLLRALEPRWGIAEMKKRRGNDQLTALCSGPGKLSMALGLTGHHHGLHLGDHFSGSDPAAKVVASPRIGISRAKDHLWRFTMADNPHVSVKPKAVQQQV